MTKNVFITGAAGFIGFHVAKFLHARGDHVLGFDNFNDYYDTGLKQDRVKELDIEVINGDLCDYQLLTKSIEKNNTTHIIHLAAQAGVRYSLVNPQAYVKSNIEGFLNILEICRQHPSIKLTYASSSSVYGLNENIPFAIDDRTDNQASLYGATKRSNELFAQTYHHLYKIAQTGLRFFTVYGPWGRPDMAYYKFTQAILNEQPIEVYNNGYLERDFTYIDDIVQGTVAAMDLGAENEIFNLGNNNPISLLTFIETLEECLGKKAIKKMVPMQDGDVLITFADISHSQELLNFSPSTSLKEGLNKFIEWYKSYYQTKITLGSSHE